MPLQDYIDHSRFNIIRIGLKFSYFFSTFLFIALGATILLWGTKTTDSFIYFFNTTNVSNTIFYLDHVYSGNFFIKDFTGVLTFLGLFAVYGYFFTHIKTVGLNTAADISSEQGKMSISFGYSLYIAISLSVIASFGFLYGQLPQDKLPEVLFILFLLILNLLYVFLFKLAFPHDRNNFEDFSNLIILINSEKTREDFQLTSIFLFFVSLEVLIYGYLFGYNPISIICIDFLILFLVWILGVFFSFPLVTSIIQLKTGNTYEGLEEISGIYIIENNEKYVEFLQEGSRRVRINQENISFIQHCEPRRSDNAETCIPQATFSQRLLEFICSRHSLNLLGSVFALLIMICINFFIIEFRSLIDVPLSPIVAFLISLAITLIPVNIILGIIGTLAFNSEGY
jgi:hypothetical protein